MRTLHGLIVAAALLLPGGATAQSDFSADDIVKHFKPAASNAGAATSEDEPKTRGVTFGAAGFGDKDEDTAKPEGAAGPAAAEPGAFNLSITFEFNSDRLTGQAQRNLKEFAEALTRPELEKLRFAVDGHTDAAGTERYNQNLSERRAAAVVQYLEAQGVDSDRLRARGFGETKPVTGNGRDPANRRVETRLLQ